MWWYCTSLPIITKLSWERHPPVGLWVDVHHYWDLYCIKKPTMGSIAWLRGQPKHRLTWQAEVPGLVVHWSKVQVGVAKIIPTSRPVMPRCTESCIYLWSSIPWCPPPQLCCHSLKWQHSSCPMIYGRDLLISWANDRTELCVDKQHRTLYREQRRVFFFSLQSKQDM